MTKAQTKAEKDAAPTQALSEPHRETTHHPLLRWTYPVAATLVVVQDSVHFHGGSIFPHSSSCPETHFLSHKHGKEFSKHRDARGLLPGLLAGERPSGGRRHC